MAVTLRPATRHDIDAVLELWTLAAENRDRPVDTREAIEALIDRDPAALLIAEDAALVGTIVVGWDGWRCHVYRLAVHPDRRRDGVGRRLVEAAEARATGLGAGRIDAMVLDDNDLGRSIWERSGYVRQDDWRRWVKPISRSSSR